MDAPRPGPPRQLPSDSAPKPVGLPFGFRVYACAIASSSLIDSSRSTRAGDLRVTRLPEIVVGRRSPATLRSMVIRLPALSCPTQSAYHYLRARSLGDLTTVMAAHRASEARPSQQPRIRIRAQVPAHVTADGLPGGRGTGSRSRPPSPGKFLPASVIRSLERANRSSRILAAGRTRDDDGGCSLMWTGVAWFYQDDIGPSGRGRHASDQVE